RLQRNSDYLSVGQLKQSRSLTADIKYLILPGKAKILLTKAVVLGMRAAAWSLLLCIFRLFSRNCPLFHQK
ncbi:MAG: hypothetical protein AAFP02_20360, partial [Bacteroidota bacterium]